MADAWESLRRVPWLLWVLAGCVLAALRWLWRDVAPLLLACGAFAGAGTALLAPSWPLLQVAVALVVAALGLALLRPRLLAGARVAPGQRSSVERLVGSQGLATAPIGADFGEVRIDGQVWDARAFDPGLTIDTGEPVAVYGIDGITLIVQPARGGHEADGRS